LPLPIGLAAHVERGARFELALLSDFKSKHQSKLCRVITATGAQTGNLRFARSPVWPFMVSWLSIDCMYHFITSFTSYFISHISP